MKITTAIFDLDGTLLNTLGDLCDSVNCAMLRHGFPAVTEEQTRQRVGNGVRRLIERCIPETSARRRWSISVSTSSAPPIMSA